MQRRLSRNAALEGARPSPLAQQTPNSPTPSAPSTPSVSSGIAVQVLPMPGMNMNKTPSTPPAHQPKQKDLSKAPLPQAAQPAPKKNVCGPPPPPPPFQISSDTGSDKLGISAPSKTSSQASSPAICSPPFLPKSQTDQVITTPSSPPQSLQTSDPRSPSLSIVSSSTNDSANVPAPPPMPAGRRGSVVGESNGKLYAAVNSQSISQELQARNKSNGFQIEEPASSQRDLSPPSCGESNQSRASSSMAVEDCSASFRGESITSSVNSAAIADDKAEFSSQNASLNQAANARLSPNEDSRYSETHSSNESLLKQISALEHITAKHQNKQETNMSRSITDLSSEVQNNENNESYLSNQSLEISPTVREIKKRVTTVESSSNEMNEQSNSKPVSEQPVLRLSIAGNKSNQVKEDEKPKKLSEKQQRYEEQQKLLQKQFEEQQKLLREQYETEQREEQERELEEQRRREQEEREKVEEEQRLLQQQKLEEEQRQREEEEVRRIQQQQYEEEKRRQHEEEQRKIQEQYEDEQRKIQQQKQEEELGIQKQKQEEERQRLYEEEQKRIQQQQLEETKRKQQEEEQKMLEQQRQHVEQLKMQQQAEVEQRQQTEYQQQQQSFSQSQHQENRHFGALSPQYNEPSNKRFVRQGSVPLQTNAFSGGKNNTSITYNQQNSVNSLERQSSQNKSVSASGSPNVSPTSGLAKAPLPWMTAIPRRETSAPPEFVSFAQNAQHRLQQQQIQRVQRQQSQSQVRSSPVFKEAVVVSPPVVYQHPGAPGNLAGNRGTLPKVNKNNVPNTSPQSQPAQRPWVVKHQQYQQQKQDTNLNNVSSNQASQQWMPPQQKPPSPIIQQQPITQNNKAPPTGQRWPKVQAPTFMRQHSETSQSVKQTVSESSSRVRIIPIKMEQEDMQPDSQQYYPSVSSPPVDYKQNDSSSHSFSRQESNSFTSSTDRNQMSSASSQQLNNVAFKQSQKSFEQSTPRKPSEKVTYNNPIGLYSDGNAVEALQQMQQSLAQLNSGLQK